MSKIQGKPFIQNVIDSLTSELKTNLLSLINGSNQTPAFRSLVNSSNYITSGADKGKVQHITLETWSKTFTGYLLYNDSYCVLVGYSRNTQDLSIISINLTTQTYTTIKEPLTILELRFILEEAKESQDVIAIVEQAIEDGGIVIETENVVTLDNVDLSSGTATKSNTGANWTLMSDDTKGCVLLLYLTTQNVYPLGDIIELKRVTLDSNEAVFGATFDYANNDTFITYQITAKCTSSTCVITVIEVEANKGSIASDSPELEDLTIGGETYKVLKASDIAAPEYSSSSTYDVGDIVTHNGLVYQCTTAVSSAEEFDSSKWTVGTIASIVLGMINIGV